MLHADKHNLSRVIRVSSWSLSISTILFLHSIFWQLVSQKLKDLSNPNLLKQKYSMMEVVRKG